MNRTETLGTVIGIDASRNRSGGAKAHLIGMLRDADPAACGIRKIHVWSYGTLLDLLPNATWLIKHKSPELERSILYQLWWQRHSLPKELKRIGCDILLNTDAGSVCTFKPAIAMSRDMLSYEPNESRRYGCSLGRLRLIVLKRVQTVTMRRAEAVIFLTNYAARTIQKQIGFLRHTAIIPHGVGDNFRAVRARAANTNRVLRCVYVSNTEPYKHQWMVVRAIGHLRKKGYKVSLVLTGGPGRGQRRLDFEVARTDPGAEFVECLGEICHEQVLGLLSDADLFIFASSCENMPNTLLEAMAAGLPIACSDRGPMPEILQDGGVYFNPESPLSIAEAIEILVTKPELRECLATRAKELSANYSWARCARETLSFLSETAQRCTVDQPIRHLLLQ